MISIAQIPGRLVRGARRWFVGNPSFRESIIRNCRYVMYERAIEYINYEMIEGDILEFGVYAGMSLVMLADACRNNPYKEISRRLVGFDSFEGLRMEKEEHPRWREGLCRKIEDWHPYLPKGSAVTTDVVMELFDRCELNRPELEVGMFQETLQRTIPQKYGRAALVHIDCDLYESTREVLGHVNQILQPGGIILFDDWFHYKGDPRKGEAGAFKEFLKGNPQWKAIQYHTYCTFSNSFIMQRE